jgi:Bacterial Ig-like domain (group 3)/NHL repeat
VETRPDNRLMARMSAAAKAIFPAAAAAANPRLGCVSLLLAMLLVAFFLPVPLRAQEVITTVAGTDAGVNIAAASFNLPTGVAVDSLGDLYVADAQNCVVWKITNGVSTVIAGIQGSCAAPTGSGAMQSLAYPIDVAVCGNNLYYATHGYDPVPSGQNISTAVAGGVYEIEISNGTFSALPVPPGPGPSPAESPYFPVALACDSNGNVYLASYFYGSDISFAGSVDEIPAGSQSTKNLIQNLNIAYSGIAVDSANNVFVLATSGATQGWLGTTLFTDNGYIDQLSNGTSTEVFTASFPNASRLTANTAIGVGNFLITAAASDGKPTVYVETVPGGIIAGNGTAGFKDNVQPTMAELDNPTGLALDACGSIYVADSGNNVVRKILNPVTAGPAGCTSGPGPTGSGASLSATLSITGGNGQILAGGTVSLFSQVGCTNCSTALQGEVFYCSFSSASFTPPNSASAAPCEGGVTLGAVAVTPTGAASGIASYQTSFPIPGTYYLAAEFFFSPYLPTATAAQPLMVCGASCTDPGVPNIPVASKPVALTPGALAVSPNGGNGIVALDAKSNQYFLNSSAGTVTLVGTVVVNGVSEVVISTIISPSTVITSTGLPLGPMSNLSDMVIGADGNLYVTDTGNSRIIQVVNPSSANPTVNLINIGSSGGTLSPTLNAPMGIFETGDEVYVTDMPASGPRLVAFRPDGSYPTTVLSSATSGAPTLGQLLGIAVNPTTLAIYVANSPAAGSSTGGNIIKTTIGGTPSVVSTPGLTLQSPYGIAMDASGGLYFSDSGSHLVYRMDVHSNVIVIAGNGTATERLGDSLLAETSVSALQTGLANPTWLALDASNSLYILDGSNLLYLDVTQSIVDFTAQGESQTIFVTNPVAGTQGSVEMEFGSPLLTGADSSDFSVASGTTCSQTSSTLLSPNTSCKLVLTLNTDSSDAAVTSCTLSEIEVSLGPPLTAGACPTATTGPPPGLTAQKINLNAITPPATTLQITGAATTGTYNVPYIPAVTFMATGGSGQYTFSETGLLPSGMILSPSGTLSGTPTQGGAFPFTVNVSDSQGDTGGLTQTLVINPASTTTTLTATPNSLGLSQPFTLTATVQYNGTPVTTSNVAFYDYNDALIGTVPLNGSGQASLAATSPATGGTYAYSATFQSTANLATSSGPANVTVTGVVIIPTIMENIAVSDAPMFPDIPVSETLEVSDQVTVTPLIGVNGVAAVYLSPVALGYGNTSGTQAITLSNVGQASLTLGGYAISGSAFSYNSILCWNGTTSWPSTMPSGGACTLLVTYNGTTGATGTVTFTDNAGLSNALQGAQLSPTSFTQIVALSGAGANTTAPPPSATVTIPTVMENIAVSDAPTFPDVFDQETITVTDQVKIAILSQTITFTTPPPLDAKAGDSFTVAAIGGASGNPVTFRVGAGSVCTLTLPATYKMTSDSGFCYVVANQAGGGNYPPAPQVTATVAAVKTVTKIAPTVTFTGAPTNAAYLSTFTVATTQNSGVTPKIRSTTTSVCTASGDLVTMKSGTGTCTVEASWAANTYYTATSLTQTTTATLLGTTTAITKTATLTPKNPLKVTVYFTVSNGTSTAVTGDVTVTASSGETCSGTVTSGKCLLTFKATDAGPLRLTAEYLGNDDDSASTSASYPPTVN